VNFITFAHANSSLYFHRESIPILELT